MALKENSRKVYDYVVAHDGEDFTAQDIADAIGVDVKKVNGSITSAFQKKGLMSREPGERTNPDGTHTPIKYIRLTEAGRAFDPDAPEAPKAE